MPSDLNGIFLLVHLTHSILETQFIYTSHLGLPQISTNSVFTYLFHFTKLLDVQAGFRKGRGSRDQTANIWCIIEKAKQFQRNTYFCSLTTLKPLTVWITTNCGKFLNSENSRPPNLSHEKPVMQIKKQQLEPDMNNRLVQNWERRKTRLYIVTWLLSLYAEYIM